MTVITLFEGFLFTATATVIAGLSYWLGKRDGYKTGKAVGWNEGSEYTLVQFGIRKK